MSTPDAAAVGPTTSAGTAPQPSGTAPQPSGPGPAGRGLGRVAGWLTAACIAASLLIMIWSGLVRRSWMVPALSLPKVGPPWELTVHVSPNLVTALLWLAAVLATAGIVIGILAARRGYPLPLRTILVAAGIAVAALTVLPPTGSTDVLDYAVYGHIAAIGHSPYVMTPAQYRNLVHLKHGVPTDWDHDPSVYGPLATAEQFAAAKIAGPSLARTVFWLKLWNSIAFAAIAVTLDRLLRRDRRARLRAHLLWTANPLIIWSVIAAGHLDVLAAGIGLAGVLIVDRAIAKRLRSGTEQPTGAFGLQWQASAGQLWPALAAGLCIGAATDIKAVFGIYALGLAWALRRRPLELLAGAVGVVAVLVASYLMIGGLVAIHALTRRATIGIGTEFYGIIFRHLGIRLIDAIPVAACLMVVVSLLALLRMPEVPERPTLRACLALSLTWLLVWPEQYAWYGVMLMVLLALYPSSRLDWLPLAWLGALTYADIPGLGTATKRVLANTAYRLQQQNLFHGVPLVLLLTLIALVVLCVNGRWNVARRTATGPDSSGGTG